MEIDSNHELIQSTTTLSKYTQQLTALHDEIASIQSEHESVTKNINDKLGLDQWCGDCKGGWGKCDGRVEYFRSTYGNCVLKVENRQITIYVCIMNIYKQSISSLVPCDSLCCCRWILEMYVAWSMKS